MGMFSVTCTTLFLLAAISGGVVKVSAGGDCGKTSKKFKSAASDLKYVTGSVDKLELYSKALSVKKAIQDLEKKVDSIIEDANARIGDPCTAPACAWGNTYLCNKDVGFNYGCKKGRCWSQCNGALHGAKEWCYTKTTETGTPMYCSTDEECFDATLCQKADCWGACALF